MTESDDVLVVGVGSSHGDDQAGWLVIDALRPQKIESICLRKAAVPHDLLDWIPGVHSLHLVDACPTFHSVQRWDLTKTSHKQLGANPGTLEPTGILQNLRSSGSHQISVCDVIDLARTLKIMPTTAVLWAIPGTRFQPGDTLTDSCARCVRIAAELIESELRSA